MRRKTKTVLIVLLILILILVGIAIWQRNTIGAFFQYLRNSETDIETMMEENDKKIEETLQKYPAITVKELSEEQKKQLTNGEITEQEAIQIITGNEKPKPEDTAAEPSKPQGGSPPSKPEENSEVNQKISELVAKVYVVQARFLGRISSIESSARAEIAALPSEEQTYERKIAIGKSKLGEISSLEAQCDGEIAGIVSQLKKLLKDSGQDTDLANTIQATYEQEKSLKKAYYMNRYL